MENIWGGLFSIPILRRAARADTQDSEISDLSAMAINTDPTFGKSALGEREVSNPTDFQDTEKLLSTTISEPTGQTNIKASDSFSLAIRGSVRSLDADQNGHRSPLKSGSIGQLTAPPRSASRISLGPLPSPVPPGSEPRSYLWLAVLSCFCPAVPLNICALWYAHVVSALFVYSLHVLSVIKMLQDIWGSFVLFQTLQVFFFFKATFIESPYSSLISRGQFSTQET